MQQSIILVLLVLVASVAAFKQDPIPLVCNQTGALPANEFSSLVEDLKATSFEHDRMATLFNFALKATRGFNGNQTATLLHLFKFDSSTQQVVEGITNNILGLTCSDVVDILKAFSFERSQLDVLKSLAPCITDMDDLELIVDTFHFSQSKKEARDILTNTPARSCIFGTVTESFVTFIVDISGSMDTQFTDNTGKVWTRLDFVEHELLSVINHQLDIGQQFNVITFNGRPASWKQGLVTATPANKDDASNWLMGKNARGGTNVYEALKTAYQFGNNEAIYLLTDGEPTVGVTDITTIANGAGAWAAQYGAYTNTIAFLSGHSNPTDRANAQLLMQKVATATGGLYKAIG